MTREKAMVPRATFSSYYGRPVLKKPVWSELDIAGYLFTGGLAAGSALVAVGADLTDRPALRREGRLAAFVFVGVSGVALVHDLGVKSRFHHMLRVVKPTS
ncbi:MAG: polysulfide reductase NrfD, partial [Frankiales bacterium]|nr:polysulfide reductase NrfD [Frankiales bacterium]